MNLKGFLKKVSHALSANILSLGISVLTTLLVPKLIGVEEFGYFQLYLFYSSYIGLLHFGWNDGVLLRLGGSEYSDLPRESIFSQFITLVVQQFTAAITVAFLAVWLIEDPVTTFILLMTAVCVVVSGPMYMLLFLLQATARIKEYARIVIIQRSLFGLLVVFLMLASVVSFEFLVYVEIVARVAALAVALYYCREVTFLRIREFFWPRREIAANIRAGLPLMISAMAGSLIIGAFRFGIADNWSISIFGEVSLALSLSSMVLTTIVAVGQVLFPLLRRASTSRLPKIYSSGRTILSMLTLIALSLYFVLVPFISYWLPDYENTAHYLGILFPLFVYQVKTSVLLEPYLKALRREKTLLWVNLGVLALSVIASWVSVYILNSLTATLASIVLLIAIRAVVLEYFVSVAMNVRFALDSISEGMVVAVFLMGVICFNSGFAFIFLVISVLFWLLFHRKSIRAMVLFLR